MNHAYDSYASSYYEPYATLIYKRDEQLVPSSWMDMQRNYHHILTNNNGDSLADLSEKELAFMTTDYPDGEYRIFVEALDEFGNSTIDSMEVRFRNHLTEVGADHRDLPSQFRIWQNYPNPFHSFTRISYALPTSDLVTLRVYDVLGQEIQELVHEFQSTGRYSVDLDTAQLPSGIYFYRLQAGNFVETRKMVLMRTDRLRPTDSHY